MAALIILKPGVDWPATGGLFDWTVEFLVSRLTDEEAVAWLRQVVDNNLGSFRMDEFPSRTQHEAVALLRDELISTAQRELPPSDHKAEAIRSLQDLVDLTYR